MPKCQLDGNFFVLQEPKLIRGRVLAAFSEPDGGIYDCLTANNFSIISILDEGGDLQKISILSSNRTVPKAEVDRLRIGNVVTLNAEQFGEVLQKKKFLGNFFILEKLELVQGKLDRVAFNPTGDKYDDLMSNGFSVISTRGEFAETTAILSYNGKIDKSVIGQLKIKSRITFCADQLIGETNN